MSTLTRCNRCTLERIKDRNPLAVVVVERNMETGWLDVIIDGLPAGHSFLGLSLECVC